MLGEAMLEEAREAQGGPGRPTERQEGLTGGGHAGGGWEGHAGGGPQGGAGAEVDVCLFAPMSAGGRDPTELPPGGEGRGAKGSTEPGPRHGGRSPVRHLPPGAL